MYSAIDTQRPFVPALGADRIGADGASLRRDFGRISKSFPARDFAVFSTEVDGPNVRMKLVHLYCCGGEQKTKMNGFPFSRLDQTLSVRCPANSPPSQGKHPDL
jgi:hypothetical protein